MKGSRTTATIVAISLVLVALVLVAGAAFVLAPAVSAQPRAAQAPRVFDLAWGGSRIGISIQDVEGVEAARRDGVTAGVFVETVTPDGPAGQAGIRAGDLIVEFDGERVRSARQFTRLVQETPAGRSVPLVLVREGTKTPLTVTPREADRVRLEGLEDLGGLVEELRGRAMMRVRPAPPTPPTPPAPPAPAWPGEDLPGRTGRLGVTPGHLSPQLAEYFGAAEGVLVSSVAEGSIAQKMGLRAGDVITAVNDTPVRTAADLRRSVQALADGDEVTLSIVRDRQAQRLQGVIESTRPAVRTRV